MGLNDIFKALSDETRRKILMMLSEKDLTAGQIASAFNQTWPTISRHLKILESTGLITSERKGRNIVYSLNTTVFEDILVFFANAKSRRDKNG
ncbi:autorepressor SdpR family transcription factor [Caldisericum exile]|uniref:ArsR family transcriptional regulator n=1 Tax=Caldisericum exile (strain DSM 21853 / NBRC 104410 / AZM16c01) TaxID=511051 RepID=A0A7U6JFB6_CALEA|nr:autorepressor SdpR family transcription factor [Caldisericum exile]BAL80254.1 ArsR family transcriptional regulator [Caldisericum exile AZM16c01]